MRFSYASKGINKIFAAEIIMFVFTPFAFIVEIMKELFWKGSFSDLSRAVVIGIISATVFTGLMIICAGVLTVVGYVQCSRDEEKFIHAIIFAIITFSLVIISLLIPVEKGQVFYVIRSVTKILEQISEMLVVIYSLEGIMHISDVCQRPDMIKSGKTVKKIVVVAYFLDILFLIASEMFTISDINNRIISLSVIIFSCFSFIIDLVEYIMYIIYLVRTKNMLKKQMNQNLPKESILSANIKELQETY